MANAVLDAPHFHSEQTAFDYVEALLWPRGPVCRHCKATSEKIGHIRGRTKPSKKHPEGLERHGLRKCYACRKTFTVRVGNDLRDTHLAMHLWLQAIHLLTSAKKGISTRHIQRLLQCSMKTAWHLTNRIREIMKPAGADYGLPPLGGSGVTVEADETYVGAKAGRKLRRPPVEKMPVVALVERNGQARSFHMTNVRASTISAALSNNDYVKHSDQEYGFFSILKRGLYGTYQHVSEAHLHRYFNEFNYRYNNRERLGVDDKTRAGLAVRNAMCRRLTYERLG